MGFVQNQRCAQPSLPAPDLPHFFLRLSGTRLESQVPLPTVFTTCAVWFGLSCLLQAGLAGWADGKAETLASLPAGAPAAPASAGKKKD